MQENLFSMRTVVFTNLCLAERAHPSLLTKAAAVAVQALVAFAIFGTITRCEQTQTLRLWTTVYRTIMRINPDLNCVKWGTCAVGSKVTILAQLTGRACKSWVTFTLPGSFLSVITVAVFSARSLQTTRTN